jgi:hypothetical protein
MWVAAFMGRDYGMGTSEIVIPSIPALPSVSAREELCDTSPILGAKPGYETLQKLIFLGNEPGPLNWSAE